MWSEFYKKEKEAQMDFFHFADCNNSLSHVETFKNHIENDSEKGRILDFMSLVNSEYPIDDSFNYQDYLKSADIPPKYENYVKEIATQFYNENKKNNII